jgi:hypothetical protein
MRLLSVSAAYLCRRMPEHAVLCRAGSEGGTWSDQATRETRLPPSILPLSLPLNLVQAVLRARGIIVSPVQLVAISGCHPLLLPGIVYDSQQVL